MENENAVDKYLSYQKTRLKDLNHILLVWGNFTKDITDECKNNLGLPRVWTLKETKQSYLFGLISSTDSLVLKYGRDSIYTSRDGSTWIEELDYSTYNNVEINILELTVRVAIAKLKATVGLATDKFIERTSV
jgi:hypothetical protein